MPEITVEEFRARQRGTTLEGSSTNVQPSQDGSVANSTQDPCTLREGEILSPNDVTDQRMRGLAVRSIEARDVTTFDLTPPILRGIDLAAVATRADFVRALTQNLPLNEYGLPTYIYRTDLLDIRRLQPTTSTTPESPTTRTDREGEAHVNSSKDAAVYDYEAIQDMLTSSMVYFVYDLGYPTFREGNPFWEKLPFEPTDAFAAFLCFLDIEGVRDLKNGLLVAYPLEQLVEWHKLYYWGLRGRAYDMYRAAHHDRLRAQRIIRMENNHYEEGEKLFKRLSGSLANKSHDEINGLEPEKLLKMLETAARLQRVAVGLPAQGGGDREPQKIPEVSVSLRKVNGHESRDSRNDEVSDSLLFNDPDSLEAAQELIITIGGGSGSNNDRRDRDRDR